MDNFSIRVLPALKEIHAVYAIDDQNMEVVLKLPDDFPLHGVNVQGVHRVGVSEEKWRAWLLGLQQVINSQVSAIQP
jgi:E3 ubiquitin-protein ligase listerin